VALRIPDLLAAEPQSAEAISSAVGVDVDRTRRLLRGLAVLGVVRQVDDAAFANTEVGEIFREGVTGSRRPLAMMHFPQSYRAWEHFLEALRTGVGAYSLAYGRTLWEMLAADAEFATRFNEGQAANSRAVGDFVAANGEFSGARLVVDVGGGKGALLAAVLRVHRAVRGTVCDLPAGLSEARAFLDEAGVGERADVVVADFFDAVPGGGDVYLLKDILHDWPDAEAGKILAVCRAAMRPGARMLVVERVVPAEVGGDPAALNPVMTDLHMMVLFDGRERTAEELSALFGAARMELSRVVRGDAFSMVEAKAV
jgi:SAM-dependent methyltransferase